MGLIWIPGDGVRPGGSVPPELRSELMTPVLTSGEGRSFFIGLFLRRFSQGDPLELIIILYAGLLAYILIQKLRGRAIPWNSTGTKDVHGKEMRQENKSELIPAIKLVLRESSDDVHPESGETITLIFTDRDSFHEEWEIIADDDAEGPTHPPGTLRSLEKPGSSRSGGLSWSKFGTLRRPA
jgi:hypothetical protein